MNSRAVVAFALLLASAGPALAQSVSLTLRDGRVTLITQNATPAAILAEWARQGQMKVVDGERVPATPLSLRLENVSEREALDIVLRGAAGYIAAPRAQAISGGMSRFDRVLIMASSPGASTASKPAPITRAAAVGAAAPAAFTPAPQVVEEEDVAHAQPAQLDDVPSPAPSPEQPASSTNFDYANPQRYFAARQAELQAAEAAQQQQQQQQQRQQPSTSPLGGLGQTSARPGVMPPPQQTPAPGNGTVSTGPYGLPPGEVPGSASVGSTMEPDRAKYINPYSPTPPRP